MKEKMEEQVAQYQAWGLREVEAEAAMGALLAQSILVARLGRLEAVASAARVCVATWHGIEASKWAMCDETQSLDDALGALDGGGNQVEVGQALSPLERYQRGFARWEAELIKNLKAVSAGEVEWGDVGRRIADALDVLDKEE